MMNADDNFEYTDAHIHIIQAHGYIHANINKSTEQTRMNIEKDTGKGRKCAGVRETINAENARTIECDICN